MSLNYINQMLKLKHNTEDDLSLYTLYISKNYTIGNYICLVEFLKKN